MVRTALLSLLVALGGYFSAAWLTHDFQVWTDEGARRLEVALRPVPLPSVTLQAQDGRPITLPAIAQGQVTIADFFYTRCQTVCLSLGSSFQQLQAALQADGDRPDSAPVRLLSLSFDGAHDGARSSRPTPASSAQTRRSGALPACPTAGSSRRCWRSSAWSSSLTLLATTSTTPPC